MAVELLQRCGPVLGLAFMAVATLIATAGTLGLLWALSGKLDRNRASRTRGLLAACGGIATTLGFLGTAVNARPALVSLQVLVAGHGTGAEIGAGLGSLNGALATTIVGLALQVVAVLVSAILELAVRGRVR